MVIHLTGLVQKVIQGHLDYQALQAVLRLVKGALGWQDSVSLGLPA
jgi:hypothetical protein